ncbi:MAG: hypothetical protein K0B05_03885 [Bacteroidales bacterium]|nr:hypothetical protein [Bacteroidales bacterium]
MKKPEFSYVRICLLLIFSAVLFAYSCEKQKKDPLFVGTWESVEQIDIGDLTFNTTRTLVLTKKTYEEVYVIRIGNSSYISAVVGRRGDLSVKGTGMTFTLKELGTCATDNDGRCTADAEWYGPGTQYYSDNIQYFKLTLTGEFEAGEFYLRLRIDTNGDGDTEDQGEDIEFERI